jgi:hypothetical protein
MRERGRRAEYNSKSHKRIIDIHKRSKLFKNTKEKRRFGKFMPAARNANDKCRLAGQKQKKKQKQNFSTNEKMRRHRDGHNRE